MIEENRIEKALEAIEHDVEQESIEVFLCPYCHQAFIDGYEYLSSFTNGLGDMSDLLQHIQDKHLEDLMNDYGEEEEEED